MEGELPIDLVKDLNLSDDRNLFLEEKIKCARWKIMDLMKANSINPILYEELDKILVSLAV